MSLYACIWCAARSRLRERTRKVGVNGPGVTCSVRRGLQFDRRRHTINYKDSRAIARQRHEVDMARTCMPIEFFSTAPLIHRDATSMGLHVMTAPQLLWQHRRRMLSFSCPTISAPTQPCRNSLFVWPLQQARSSVRPWLPLLSEHPSEPLL